MDEKKRSELREVVRLRVVLSKAVESVTASQESKQSIEIYFRNAMVSFCRDWGQEGEVHYVVVGDTLCVIPPKHRPGTSPDPEILFEQFETVK